MLLANFDGFCLRAGSGDHLALLHHCVISWGGHCKSSHRAAAGCQCPPKTAPKTAAEHDFPAQISPKCNAHNLVFFYSVNSIFQVSFTWHGVRRIVRSPVLLPLQEWRATQQQHCRQQLCRRKLFTQTLIYSNFESRR